MNKIAIVGLTVLTLLFLYWVVSELAAEKRAKIEAEKHRIENLLSPDFENSDSLNTVEI